MSEKINLYNIEKAQDEAERIREKARDFAKSENSDNLDYQAADEMINKEDRLYQGSKASEVFEGKTDLEAVEILYGESAEYFSKIIRERAAEKDRVYDIADFGCHKGELFQKMSEYLLDYKYHSVGIDLEKNLKENHTEDEKVPADLSDIPLGDKSVDFGIARYVLVWNDPEKQQEILKEISRVIKDFAIVQHAGADNQKSDEWRVKFDDLFDGAEVPKLERHGYFFSSRDEIEKWLKESNINFERILERKVNKVSDVFIQRFALDEEGAKIVRRILGDKDYIIQTTWIISKKK